MDMIPIICGMGLNSTCVIFDSVETHGYNIVHCVFSGTACLQEEAWISAQAIQQRGFSKIFGSSKGGQ